MQLSGILLAALGLIGFGVWHAYLATPTNSASTNRAVRPRNSRTSVSFLTKPLNTVDDARIAAAVMMVALGQNDGALSGRERNAILSSLETYLGATPALAEAMLAHAQRLVCRHHDVNYTFREMAPVVRRQCCASELNDLLDMLEEVSVADGAPGRREQLALGMLRATL